MPAVGSGRVDRGRCSHLVYHVLSKYTQDGKKPASKTPRMTLKPAIAPHEFTNPIPIITTPHSVVMTDKWIRGPMLRTMTVDGGWQMT